MCFSMKHNLFSSSDSDKTMSAVTEGLCSDFDSNISFITSNKGQRLLVTNENIYQCNKKTERKKYWKCVVVGCVMSIHTNENDSYLCGGKTNHDHQPHSDLIQAKNLHQQMKQRVSNEMTSISVIYEEETAKTTIDRSVLAAFPTNQEIRKGLSTI